MKKVTIIEIYIESRVFIREYNYKPEYVMIHTSNKESLYNEANSELYINIDHNTGNNYAFGAKVIWTTDIMENDIIFTVGKLRK